MVEEYEYKSNGHLLKFYEKAKQRKNLRNNLDDVKRTWIFMAVWELDRF